MSTLTPHFCMHCGAKLEMKSVSGKERPACPVCGWIYFADPKVAAAVLLVVEGKVLLTQRLYEPHKDKWSLPAGFVDAFENPETAAERECLEETGLQVRCVGLVDVISGREHPHGADIVLVYRVELMGGELRAGDDAVDAKFFSIDNFPPLAFEATRKTLSSLML